MSSPSNQALSWPANVERFVRNLVKDHLLLFAVAITVALFVCAAFFRLQPVELRLNVNTQAVSVRVARDARRINVDALLGEQSTVLAGDFDRIDLNSPGCKPVRRVNLKGQLSVASLDLKKGAVLKVRRTAPGELQIQLSGKATAILSAGGSVTVADAGSVAAQCATVRQGASISLDLEPLNEPADMTLKYSDPNHFDFEFPDVVPIAALSFCNEAGASDIVSGDVTLGATNSAVTLNRGDAVDLGDFGRGNISGNLTRLVLNDSELQVEAAGIVNQVDVGPPGFMHDLRPTYLTYLINLNWLVKLCFVFGWLLTFAWRLRGWAKEGV